MLTPIRIVIQARLSSRRFPAKVLAPFRGRPLIDHVIDRVGSALPATPLVVATSTELSDVPLVRHLEGRGTAVFRGPLQDVRSRFRLCACAFPCEWILRISADSPLMDARIVRAVAAGAGADLDLVTTTCPRSFPRGHNVELVRTALFHEPEPSDLVDDDREHVTSYFYRHLECYRIVNLSSGQPALADIGLAVDTMDDLLRLEAVTDEFLAALPYDGLALPS